MDKSFYLSFAAIPMVALGGAVGMVAAGQFTQGHTVQTASSATQASQTVALTVLPGGRLGPDKHMHDVITNADFTVVAGTPVKLTVYNYDGGTHSVTNSALKLNLQAKGSPKQGVPGVTSFTFTPSKPGNYTWRCMDPCDTENGGWAMKHDGYMEGVIHVVPPTVHKQYVYLTVKDGLQYSPIDKQIHDSFSPASFAVQAGEPVEVVVQNYDTGMHSITSSALGLNQMIQAAKAEGVPTTTTFTFVPKHKGAYHWQCIVPCDGNGWAMKHSGFMSGTITVD